MHRRAVLLGFRAAHAQLLTRPDPKRVKRSVESVQVAEARGIRTMRIMSSRNIAMMVVVAVVVVVMVAFVVVGIIFFFLVLVVAFTWPI